MLTDLLLLRRCGHTKADQHAHRHQGRGRAAPTDGPAAGGPELVSSEQVSPTCPPDMNPTARAPFLHVRLAVCRFPYLLTATCSVWGQHCARRPGRGWYGVRFPAHDYHEPTPGLRSGLLKANYDWRPDRGRRWRGGACGPVRPRLFLAQSTRLPLLSTESWRADFLKVTVQTYDFKRARDLILGTQGTFVPITFKKNGSAQRFTGPATCRASLVSRLGFARKKAN